MLEIILLRVRTPDDAGSTAVDQGAGCQHRGVSDGEGSLSEPCDRRLFSLCLRNYL
jgi:hypothetical protein